jgi:hypothetical protein
MSKEKEAPMTEAQKEYTILIVEKACEKLRHRLGLKI